MLKPDDQAPDGCRAPLPGELFKNPTLAETFRTLAREGKRGFYMGRIGQALVDVVQSLGGRITLDDLENHAKQGSQEVDPISLKFTGHGVGDHTHSTETSESSGVEVWEHPPNGQGIVALMALGLLQEFEKSKKTPTFAKGDHNSVAYLHAVIEALRIAFADANWWVADPDVEKVPSQELISPEYLTKRAKLFNPSRASDPLTHGEPSPAHNHSDTVYFSVTDRHGNGMSFINSNYGGYGTCIIPQGCGFTLQNRGANFVLQPPDHPNILAPSKRPYHTIIPAMITNPTDGSLHTVYGVMGGFMQPQGHVQVLLNMVVFGLNPQAALDAPRMCIGAGMPDDGEEVDRSVYLEDGVPEDVVQGLAKLGHEVCVVEGMKRGMFGRGQVIRAHWEDGRIIYSAGSDPRGDGMAMPV